MTAEQDAAALKAQAQVLEDQLKDIKTRLDKIEE
jgi:hypothetical protein